MILKSQFFLKVVLQKQLNVSSLRRPWLKDPFIECPLGAGFNKSQTK